MSDWKPTRASTQALFLVVLATLILVANASWSQKASLTQEAQTALDDFLNHDCAVGQKHVALDRLIEANRQTFGGIENALRDILLIGDPSDSLDILKEGLARSWAERQAFLAKGKNIGLTDSEVKLLQTETKDVYIDRNLKRHKAQHQHNSIIALAAIRSDAAFAALAEARKTGNAKLQAIIDAAVKRAKSSAVGPGPAEGKSQKKNQEGPIKQKEMMR